MPDKIQIIPQILVAANRIGHKTTLHSFLKQCFAQSSIKTMWWYLNLKSAEFTLKIKGTINLCQFVKKDEIL